MAPVEPLGFLRLLVEGTRRDAQRLGGLVYDGYPETFESEVEEEVSLLTRRMENILSLLGQ